MGDLTCVLYIGCTYRALYQMNSKAFLYMSYTCPIDRRDLELSMVYDV